MKVPCTNRWFVCTTVWFILTMCWYKEWLMFILKGLQRAKSQENALVYLMLRGEGYARAIASFYAMPVNPIQKQLARLEEDGVIVSEPIGRVRNYRLNPRYPFIEPLTQLLKAAVAASPPRA